MNQRLHGNWGGKEYGFWAGRTSLSELKARKGNRGLLNEPIKAGKGRRGGKKGDISQWWGEGGSL